MNKTTKRALLTILLIGVAVSSCYEIINTSAPAEVTGTETFTARMVCADDGSDTQNFTSDWSIAAVRVPEGWSVDVPKGAHQQYAEDWVYYSDGSQVNSQQNMAYNAHLSDLFNAGNTKKGYRWWAFMTTKMVPKHMTAYWRNGCDSIAVYFLITPDGVPGSYSIDFIAGDEEDTAGPTKYKTFAEAAGTRVLHCSTVASFSGGKKAEHVATAFSRTVTVKEASGVTATQQDKPATMAVSGVYDAEGRFVRPGNSTQGLPAGIYFVDGKKVISR